MRLPSEPSTNQQRHTHRDDNVAATRKDADHAYLPIFGSGNGTLLTD